MSKKKQTKLTTWYKGHNVDNTSLKIMNLRAANIPEGKPPPKNMLKRSSGVMSASKPRWKSKPPPCE